MKRTAHTIAIAFISIFAVVFSTETYAQDSTPEKFSGSVPSGNKMETFDGYSIIGPAKGGVYSPGEVIILDQEKNIILKGQYQFVTRFITYAITGDYYTKTPAGWDKRSGIFAVSNSSDGSLVAKKSKSLPISITAKEIATFDGFYKDYKVKFENNQLDIEFNNTSSIASVIINTSIKSLPDNIGEVVDKAFEDVSQATITFANGEVFNGIVKGDGDNFCLREGIISKEGKNICRIYENSCIISSEYFGLEGFSDKIQYRYAKSENFHNLSEIKAFCKDILGEAIFENGTSLACKIDLDNHVCNYRKYTSEKSNVQSMEITDDGDTRSINLELKGVWNIGYASITIPKSSYTVSENLSLDVLNYAVEGTFRSVSNDTFTGKFSISNEQIKLAQGTYVYSNGDKFVGDMSSSKAYGFPIDGYYELSNGETIQGDYFLNAEVEDRHKSMLDGYSKPYSLYSKIKELQVFYSSKQKYDGPFMGGHAEYYYYETNDGRIYDGPFHFYMKGAAVDAPFEVHHNVTFDAKGDFNMGKRHGRWTIVRGASKVIAEYDNGYHNGLYEIHSNYGDMTAHLKMNKYDGPITYTCYEGITNGQYEDGVQTGVWKTENKEYMTTIVYDYTESSVKHYQIHHDTGKRDEYHNKPKPEALSEAQMVEAVSDPENNYQWPSTFFRLPDVEIREW